MQIDTLSSQKSALEFKSTSLNVPVLLLSDNNLTSIAQQLQEKINQAPEFFKNSPLLIDFQKLTNQNLALSVTELTDLVRHLGLMPIGIRGGNEQQTAESLAINLPVHSIHGQNSSLAEKKSVKPIPTQTSENTRDNKLSLENKLITQPVRSGQRVYAKGDLIVTATVSAGAELLAEGNIHIYGSLRGRALAGVLGNIQSRIFCSDLQAELISIAGIYQLSDDMGRQVSQKPVQISLENQTLIIKDI